MTVILIFSNTHSYKENDFFSAVSMHLIQHIYEILCVSLCVHPHSDFTLLTCHSQGREDEEKTPEYIWYSDAFF